MTEWQDDDTFETTYGTLRKAMAEAQEAERERIIALLQGLKGDCPMDCNDCENHASSIWEAIALIKGENK